MFKEKKLYIPALVACLIFPAVLAACSLLPDRPLSSVTSSYTPPPAKAQVEDPPLNSNILGQLPTVESLQATVLAPTRRVPSPEVTMAASATQPSVVEGNSAQPICDQVAPGNPIDVTVPDGMIFQPGEPFSKTWRLVNSGSCAWTPDYSIVWFSGQPMGGSTQQPVSQNVQPGQSIDLTVDMVAPSQQGRFQSNWKLRNAKGDLFGLGPNGDAPFWVQIEVMEDATTAAPVEPTVAPTLAVYASGSANLVSGDGFDLDKGQINPTEGIDFYYQVPGPEGKPQLVPAKSVRLELFGATEPKEDDCRFAAQTVSPLSLIGIENGVYICYRTGQGLPGFAHLIKPSETDSMISVDYLTWTVP